MHTPIPTYDVDLYSDDVHLNPFPYFKALRDLGAAVWLPQHSAWAIPRYKDVRECLRNTDVFVTAALLANGIEIPMSCESGVCGTCVTGVLEGQVDHRDMYFTDDEKALNERLTPCCSREIKFAGSRSVKLKRGSTKRWSVAPP